MNIEQILKKLTLEEKAALVQGWSMWTTRDLSKKGIPSMFLADGPHGLRRQAGPADNLGLNESLPATCFPTAATMANSWNTELGEEMGRALGAEAAAQEVNVLLGPGLNIKRSPLCGRNFEYFSEDPYLAGKMAAAYIRGIQENGVSACPKHFAANSQELRRMSTDSVMDERTLREIYLTAFEIAVTEGHPKSIMSSYNLINGIYSNENEWLLKKVLREEWGFDGFVVTDWGADNDHVLGIQNGSNLTMPGPGADAAISLVQAVKDGKLSENDLDQRLRELIPVILSTTEAVSAAPKQIDPDAHHALARKCAAESIVLLENDGILPLKNGTRAALIGEFAETPRFQGAGSSLVNPTKVDCLKDALKSSGLYLTGFAKGYTRENSEPDTTLIHEAVTLAMGADVVLLCVGLDERSEMEGRDRATLKLPESQVALLNALCRVNSNIVLILSGGSPFLMPASSQFRAAIHGYLGGQAGAGAMADALLGQVNPSGKLSETWPLALEVTPCHRYFPGMERTCEYREGIYVGYRYYDTAGVPVRYPFGHGLSYTNFTYSDLKASTRSVTFTLTNTGTMDGAEAVQVYVSCKDGKIFRAKKELKGFRKVFLKAGESKTVTIGLDDKAFRYFNVKTGKFETETAHYEVIVSSSSEKAELSTTIRIFGTEAENPYSKLPSYETGKISDVSDAEFEALLGHPIPEAHWSGPIQPSDPLCRLADAKSPLARLIHNILMKKLEEDSRKPTPDMMTVFIYNMPLRAFAKNSGGLVSTQMVDDFAFLANGHSIWGLYRFARDFLRNKKQAKKFEETLK
ncbi:MAG: glycoside hydrolase family 3 C-terminal domain-containing protein [Oscillospiraceae bacterium]|nr:glycoside hydrolase family 3 C-terminal domain-containing protein [Oscillospiraceae bacterium]